VVRDPNLAYCSCRNRVPHPCRTVVFPPHGQSTVRGDPGFAVRVGFLVVGRDHLFSALNSAHTIFMATQPVIDTPVSVEQYLSTVFEHDCEFVDGIIEERGMGEFEHSCIQSLLIGIFLKYREDWGVFPLPEQRVQTRQRNYRVPDVLVLRSGSPREQIIKTPPLLAIEIQSPEDSLRRTAAKTAEYLEFGIEHVWVIDPYARVAYRGTADGLELARSGELSIPGSPICIVLDDLFAELDRV